MTNTELKNEIIQSLEKGAGEHYFNQAYEILTNVVVPPSLMVVGISIQPVDKTPLFRRIPRSTHIPFKTGFTGYLQKLMGVTSWRIGSFFHEGKTSVLFYKDNIKYLVELILARRYTFFPTPTDCTPDNPGKLLNRDEVEALFAKLRNEHCYVDDWETLIGVVKAHGWYGIRKFGQQLLLLAYNV